MDGNIQKVLVEYDPNGSLATTHKGQGSDMGLFSGFLGWEAHDERLPKYLDGVNEAGIAIEIDIVELDIKHPNTYKITLENQTEKRELTAISTGGGMIEVLEIDGAKVSTQATFIEIKASTFLTTNILEELKAMDGVTAIKQLHPVLPILARKDLAVPFIYCDELLKYNEGKDLALWELAARYESIRGNISEEAVFEKMRDLVHIMQHSIDEGLKGTEYKDRILGCQSKEFQAKMQDKTLVHAEVLNEIILCVTAMMEIKSSMGVIVAAPTAGACGALPGAILGACSAMNLSEDMAIKAMLSAGMIGVFIAAHATFAAEVGGCQAECGSGAGMAAAGITFLGGGTLVQSISAASQALQNSLGMICDPIANRVEAPCLGKNVMAASNALSCANMALANYDHLIPLDEVIDTMDKVGKSIPNDLRCTTLGGLSITKTSKEIEKRLAENSPELETEIRLSPSRFKVC